MRAMLALFASALAAAPASADATWIPGGEVRAAFTRGAPLLETAAYKVHASRRTAPGEAEIHVRDTDLIYVLEGSATLVTGGTLVGGRDVAPGELRGASIEGGDARALAPGDVVVVPHGTPHWFREVDGPLLYYVVKVTAPSEPGR